MPSYLVETYLARDSGGQRLERERRAHSVAEELTRDGTRVRFLGSTYIPEDEMCFFTFDAASTGDVALVAQLAGFHSVRIVEALSSGKETL